MRAEAKAYLNQRQKFLSKRLELESLRDFIASATGGHQQNFEEFLREFDDFEPDQLAEPDYNDPNSAYYRAFAELASKDGVLRNIDIMVGALYAAQSTLLDSGGDIEGSPAVKTSQAAHYLHQDVRFDRDMTPEQCQQLYDVLYAGIQQLNQKKAQQRGPKKKGLRDVFEDEIALLGAAQECVTQIAALSGYKIEKAGRRLE